MTKQIILLDGFDWSYLKFMPNLKKLIKKSWIAKIRSSPLYLEHITFWRGDYPDKHNFLTSTEIKRNLFERIFNFILKRRDKTFLDELKEKVIVHHKMHPDKLGHYEYDKLKDYIAHIDYIVLKLCEKCEETIICSDHGMVKVNKKIDLQSILRKCKYIKKFLIGSTCAYIHVKKGKEKEVEAYLNTIPEGKILWNRKEYHLPKTDYLVFVADYKTAFVPNHFEKDIQAAHGWLEPTYFPFIYYKKGLKYRNLGVHNVIDVAPTIIKLWGVQKDDKNGKPFV